MTAVSRYQRGKGVCPLTVALPLLACGGPARPAENSRAPLAAATSKTAETPGLRCAGEPPSYERTIRPLIEQYCFECHARGGSATEEHDFERFETLFRQRRRVAAAVRAHAMPPNSAKQLLEAQRVLVVRWAGCG